MSKECLQEIILLRDYVNKFCFMAIKHVVKKEKKDSKWIHQVNFINNSDL